MRGLLHTVRLMHDVLDILKRIKIYLEYSQDCPYLKQNVDEMIQQVEKYVSPIE